MAENENLASELMCISNYGSFEEALELLKSNRNVKKEEAKTNQENDSAEKDATDDLTPSHHQKRYKSRKNNRGTRGNYVIIPPEFAYDADYPSPIGRAQALMPSNTNYFDDLRRELKEINSIQNRNESIEDHYNSIRHSDEETPDRYSDAETRSRYSDAESQVGRSGDQPLSNPKESPPRKADKKDKKSRNALLTSLAKGLSKINKSEDKNVKTDAKPNEDPDPLKTNELNVENLKIDPDSNVESQKICSSFVVDDSVDKVKVAEHLLSELQETIFSSGQNESEDDFFSAHETLTSPEPNGNEPSSKKKGYHGTSRRGFLMGATNTNSNSKKVNREKKKKFSKIDLNELPSNRNNSDDGSYSYEPCIHDHKFKFNSSDFPPL